MERQPIHIAIIGGGPAGVSLCLQLTQVLKRKAPITKIIISLFEKSDSLGVGLPYNQSHEDAFCINLPKKYMVLMPEQYNHFSNWLAPRTDNQSTFPPRYYFGQYAQEQLASIHDDAHYELNIYREHHILVIKRLAANHYQIHAQHKTQVREYFTQYIIFATGHLPNPTFAHLHQNGCQRTPWDIQHYQKIPINDHVGIVGTRLTAIDAVLKLKQQHKGPISLFSRSGLLSSVRGEHPLPQMNYLTPHNVQKLLKTHPPLSLLPELIALFEQDIADHLPPPHNVWAMLKILQSLSPLERLQSEIKQAEQQQTTWQSVLSCLYQFMFKLWPFLPLTSKAQFLKKHHSVFLSLLCSFPLEKAYDLYDMMRQGQLQVQKGLLDVSYSSPHFLLHCESNIYSCEYLILALGSGTQPEVIPLYAQMLQDGLIKKHPLGGLSVNLKTYQLHDKSHQNTTMYALGDIIKGACFNMVEIGQIVEQAAVITRQILNTLYLETSPRAR